MICGLFGCGISYGASWYVIAFVIIFFVMLVITSCVIRRRRAIRRGLLVVRPNQQNLQPMNLQQSYNPNPPPPFSNVSNDLGNPVGAPISTNMNSNFNISPNNHISPTSISNQPNPMVVISMPEPSIPEAVHHHEPPKPFNIPDDPPAYTETAHTSSSYDVPNLVTRM